MNTIVALSNSQVQTMSSRELAELTGKEHKHVMRDIRTLKEQLGEMFVGAVQKRKSPQNLQEYAEYLLDKHTASILLDKYKGLARVPNRLQEEASLKTIEQLLGVKLIRQYKVLSYRLDGYDPDTNTAYEIDEIDEPEHRYKHAKDAERQQKIEAVLGCKFVRIAL